MRWLVLVLVLSACSFDADGVDTDFAALAADPLDPGVSAADPQAPPPVPPDAGPKAPFLGVCETAADCESSLCVVIDNLGLRCTKTCVMQGPGSGCPMGTKCEDHVCQPG